MWSRSRCSSCDAEVIWAVTVKGRRMPVDAEPTADGNVVLNDVGLPAPQAIVLGGAGGPHDTRTLHRSHFASCPQAAQHRRQR